MIDAHPDALFRLATRYWNRLKEFVDNQETAYDYVLARVKKEHEINKEKTDFNELYKKQFTAFVMATHELVEQKLHHAPSSRCFFVAPSDEHEKNDLSRGIGLEKRLDDVWVFTDDVPVEYINSINDIVRKLHFKDEWTKDCYVSEQIAKKYVGTVQDGKPFCVHKKLFEIYYRSYGDIHVRIIATKTFPGGPFKFVQAMRLDDEHITEENINGVFPTERNLDDFVIGHKKNLDKKYERCENE